MFRKYLHFSFEILGFVLLFFRIFIPARKQKILSVYFHNPPVGLFEKLIKYLIKKRYRFVSLDEFDEIINSKNTNEKIVICTIDDGWQNNLNLLNVIRKYQIPVTIFITTSAIETGNFWFDYIMERQDLSESQKKREVIRIKKLAADDYYNEILKLIESKEITRTVLTREELIGLSMEKHITIGSHTVSHICLPDKPPEIQERELLDSKKMLETWTGKVISYFSYPGGDYTEIQKKMAEQYGYKMCFTTETSHIEINNIDKYTIPRRCINDDAGFLEALAKLYGVWYWLKK
jgi:poly-beta-1,6-N-acetyl-D-glucosamine N-deacetylase